MNSFKEWFIEADDTETIATIEEAFSADTIPDKRSKTAELFLGRMQPVHQGHVNIIKKMKNPIVVLVKGKASSADKDRNPLDAKTQERMLKLAVPGIKVIIAKAGYLPEIYADLRQALIHI
jgi:hypothetical protein